MSAPASALAQDPAAEIPDIAVSEPQPVTTGPSYGIAKASSIPALWATVNICDTARAPDSMGVRASMPGRALGQHMYMRFRAEYWSRARQDWASVGGSGVSPWVYAGPARYERRQAGWTFKFAPPPAGVTFTMRAIVEFQWRAPVERVARKARKRGARRGRGNRPRMIIKRAKAARSRVVRSVTRMTETGIDGVHGGDPEGTSKAMCLIY
jgi:hypothetical protein